jgi:hypothetical protein
MKKILMLMALTAVMVVTPRAFAKLDNTNNKLALADNLQIEASVANTPEIVPVFKGEIDVCSLEKQQLEEKIKAEKKNTLVKMIGQIERRIENCGYALAGHRILKDYCAASSDAITSFYAKLVTSRRKQGRFLEGIFCHDVPSEDSRARGSCLADLCEDRPQAPKSCDYLERFLEIYQERLDDLLDS